MSTMEFFSRVSVSSGIIIRQFAAAIELIMSDLWLPVVKTLKTPIFTWKTASQSGLTQKYPLT